MDDNETYMQYKVRIDDAVKDFDLANNVKFLNVSYSILDENEDVVERRKEAFPFDTEAGDIKASLQKLLSVFVDDIIKKKENQQVDELEAQADETIEAIVDKEVELEPQEEE